MDTNLIRTLVARSIPFQIRRKIPFRIVRHLYFKGVFEARIHGERIVKLLHVGHQIENEIYWRGFDGCHEAKSMQVFAIIVEKFKPQVVWDIGANSGTYGILAKALQPECEVVFFEPIPKAVGLLRENLYLNGFEAKVFDLAVGDFDGLGEIFFRQEEDFAFSVTVNQNTVPKEFQSKAVKIQVRRLDTLITENELPPPDFVKLDVETYEYEVLKGWGHQFPQTTIFLIEILRDDLANKLIEFFPAEKFQFWNINDQKMSMRKVETLSKSDFYNFLVVPNNMSKTIEDLIGFT